MKKGLIFLADGFEEIEGLTVFDVLKRAGIHVDLISIKKCHKVHASHGVTILANLNRFELAEDYKSYDFIVLPGGKLGVENLESSRYVHQVIKYMINENKVVAAICAAPSILGNMGILDGKNFTCFPGFERGNGHKVENVGAVIDGNIITGRSMAYSYEFAKVLLKHLEGEGTVNNILKGTEGLN